MGAEVENLIKKELAGAYSAKLFSVGLDGMRALCLRWPGPFDDPLELLEQVEERALRQANSLGGVQAFQFEMYDNGGNALGSECFRLSAEAFSGDRSLLSEPANEGGVLAQVMRQNEALLRTQALTLKETTVSWRQNLDAAHRMVEAVGRRAEFSETKYLEGLQVLQKVLTGESEHAVAMKKAEGNAKAKELLAERVAGLLPMVAGAFVQNGPAKSAAHATLIGAKNLFTSLSQAQIQAFLDLLSPEQRAQVYVMFESVLKYEQEASPPRPGTNGAAPPAGGEKATASGTH